MSTAAELCSPVVFFFPSQAKQIPKQDLLMLANHCIYQRITIKVINAFFIQGFYVAAHSLYYLCLNRLYCNIWFLYAQSTDCIKVEWINSVEKQSYVAFFLCACRLNAIYCCPALFKWPAFCGSQFFNAQKAGYNHPPLLDS